MRVHLRFVNFPPTLTSYFFSFIFLFIFLLACFVVCFSFERKKELHFLEDLDCFCKKDQSYHIKIGTI